MEIEKEESKKSHHGSMDQKQVTAEILKALELNEIMQSSQIVDVILKLGGSKPTTYKVLKKMRAAKEIGHRQIGRNHYHSLLKNQKLLDRIQNKSLSSLEQIVLEGSKRLVKNIIELSNDYTLSREILRERTNNLESSCNNLYEVVKKIEEIREIEFETSWKWYEKDALSIRLPAWLTFYIGLIDRLEQR
jgi:hypothetical protein